MSFFLLTLVPPFFMARPFVTDSQSVNICFFFSPDYYIIIFPQLLRRQYIDSF